MKLKIEKLSTGGLRIELQTSPKARPMVRVVTIEELRNYLAILEAGARGEKFSIELELGD